MNPTLELYIKNDPRILDVYLDARRRYAEIDWIHHNFTHVMRDLHRALVIADNENGVNYSVLIPAVLLHDIGFCTAEYKKLGHDLAGAPFAVDIMAGYAFNEGECQAVAHCIRAHKGIAELPQSIEAKILYDADVLEKSGMIFLIWAGKIISEFGEELPKFLKREIAARGAEADRGFFTRKARELDGGRLAKVPGYCRQIFNEISEERPDFQIDEQDLWQGQPPDDGNSKIEI